MKMSNQTYDTLMWIAQFLLPGLGTLYAALSGIWGLPYGEQVVGTLAALDTFLGVMLGLSNAKYKANMVIQSVQNQNYRVDMVDEQGNSK